MNFKDAIKAAKPAKTKRGLKTYYLTEEAVQKIKDLSTMYGLSQNIALESVIKMIDLDLFRKHLEKPGE